MGVGVIVGGIVSVGVIVGVIVGVGDGNTEQRVNTPIVCPLAPNSTTTEPLL